MSEGDRERELRIQVRSVEGGQYLPMTLVPEAWRGRAVRVELVDDLPGFPLGDDGE